MLLVPVEKLSPGQTVAQDVTDPQGILLFKAGTALTADLIGKLKSRNVAAVHVEGTEGSGLTPEEIEKRKVQIDQDVNATFSDVASDPLMNALCEAAKRHLKNHIR